MVINYYLINRFLAGNPLSCDCNLVLFRSFFVAGVYPKDDDILRCQWPTNNLTRDLSLADFQCCKYDSMTLLLSLMYSCSKCDSKSKK